MSRSLVLCSWLLVVGQGPAAMADETFRPEPGKFPPAEKAESYMGELVFVDHANRRGKIRVPTQEHFFRQTGRPFAMLPYGIVRYHGAPADLRDIPLGTIMHGRFYLPPDPERCLVPEVDQANHAILLEDEPSYCQREGLVWKLQQIELKGNEGMIVARRVSKDDGNGEAEEEKFTIDDTTRFWRGREKLTLEELTADGLWPASGKKMLDGQSVYLGLTWQPMGMGNHRWWGGAFNGFHISDIWLDETAMQRATEYQTKVHKEFIRGRWMPAWVDDVEYGKFGEATVAVTLFGGMDPSFYDDFKKASRGQMGGATMTLKHSHGAYTHAHMAIQGSMEVDEQEGNSPLGSSGIQVRLKIDLVLEAFRPGRIVRIRPMNWPADPVPREEWIGEEYEDRFPTPAIFNK